MLYKIIIMSWCLGYLFSAAHLSIAGDVSLSKNNECYLMAKKMGEKLTEKTAKSVLKEMHPGILYRDSNDSYGFVDFDRISDEVRHHLVFFPRAKKELSVAVGEKWKMITERDRHLFILPDKYTHSADLYTTMTTLFGTSPVNDYNANDLSCLLVFREHNPIYGQNKYLEYRYKILATIAEGIDEAPSLPIPHHIAVNGMKILAKQMIKNSGLGLLELPMNYAVSFGISTWHKQQKTSENADKIDYHILETGNASFIDMHRKALLHQNQKAQNSWWALASLPFVSNKDTLAERIKFIDAVEGFYTCGVQAV